MTEVFTSGFEEMEKELSEYAEQASPEEVSNVLKIGADAFTKDLLALPKPRSRIAAPGYTHLIDTFSDKEDPMKPGAWIVGWGKYYGPILEAGRYPHLKNCWETNKEKYYKLMQGKFGGK